jgi:hypothetical protein
MLPRRQAPVKAMSTIAAVSRVTWQGGHAMTTTTRKTAAALALAFAATVTAGAEREHREAVGGPGAQLRPFGAVLDVRTTPGAQTDCTLEIIEAGTGRAVHMGAITWEATETLNFCEKPEDANAAINGTFVMTAANGDQVHGQYATLQYLDPATGVFTFSGQWSIAGGTGRFQDAAGQGTLSGEGRLSAPPVSVMGTMVGALSY